MYLSYPNSGRCALKSPAIIVLVFASFMSGRSEFVPGGQYILWMVNFVLGFVQIVVFLPININIGGFCYGRLPPKASSRVDSNCGIHFWGLYFSCWDQFRLWFVAVLSRRHSPLVMGPCGRLCLIHFTSPGLVTHHDRVTSCLHRFCQSWHLFPVATAISYRLSVFLMSKVLWWGVQYQIPTGYPP